MKKIIFSIFLYLIILLISLSSYAASSCNPEDPVDFGTLHYIDMPWTADTDGSFSATPTDHRIDGLILGVETDPGATAPTDNYDIALNDANGIDVMGGALADRDTANTEFAAPLVNGVEWMVPVVGVLQLAITNNSVNSATGLVRIWYWSNK